MKCERVMNFELKIRLSAMGFLKDSVFWLMKGLQNPRIIPLGK